MSNETDLYDAIRCYYIPAARQIIREHEEWCRIHPEVAAWLGTLPNGGWRKGVLKGE